MEFINPRFTGSVGITGSVSVTGSVDVLGSITGSLEGTASYALQSKAAFPYTGSALITGTLLVTDEFSLGIISGSPFTASQVISSSVAGTRLSGSFSGSFEGFGGNLSGLVTVLGITSSAGTGSVDLITQSLTLTGSQLGIVTSTDNTGSVVFFRLDDDVQISQSLYVTDYLYVTGGVYISESLAVTGTTYLTNVVATSITSSQYTGSLTGYFTGSFEGFGTGSFTGSFTGSLQGTSSWADTASYLDGFIGQGVTLSFLTASTTWSVNHGLNTLYPLVSIWESGSEEVIQPDVIESKNLNITEIRFTVPKTGYANIGIAGAPLYQASPFFTASFALTASFVSGGVNVQNSISASYAATASYVANVGNIVNISGSAPTGSAVQVGDLWYDDTTLTLFVRYQDPSGSQWWVPAFNGVLSNSISSSYSYTSQISNGFTSSFLSQSTVIVNHNLNTRALGVTVYDDLHYQVIPSSVQLSDNNNAVIQFFSVESGYVVIK
jgi:hypothetical protein